MLLFITTSYAVPEVVVLGRYNVSMFWLHATVRCMCSHLHWLVGYAVVLAFSVLF